MKIHDAPLRNEDVRQKNEKLVLQAIQKNQAMSQSEVVSLTGLKAPTVLRIFSYLEERGLIRTIEVPERLAADRKGRKPVFYQVNPKAHYAVGLEFWSRQVSIIMTDFQKNLTYRKTLKDIEFSDAEALMKIIGQLIDEAISSSECSGTKEKILGIGVGAPGRIDTESGKVIYYGRIPGLFRFPIRERLEKRFGIPVFVNNNANVAAVSAWRRGVARDAGALITILIRSGVGGAFINNGELMLVQGRTAMELGHAAIDLDGPECVCGARGCLEAYITEHAVLAEAAACCGVRTMDELDALAGAGETSALALLKRKGALLGIEARNLFRIFSPDSFLVMTEHPNISRIYAEQVEDALRGDFFCDDTACIRVFHAVYDSVEAGRGAADLVFDDYFRPGG